MKSYKKFHKRISSVKQECSKAFATLTNDPREKDSSHRLIIDQHGATHVAYDIEDIKKHHRRKRAKVNRDC